MIVTPETEQLIERFISGIDTSIEAANGIEAALDDGFPADDHVRTTVEMLAMYRPEGGDFLFGTAAIKERLTETMGYLKKARRMG
jgi:hypothetical protein